MIEPPKVIAIEAHMLGVVCRDTSEEDATASVDDETSNLVQACEQSVIKVDGKPDDPPGDCYVFRLGERGDELFSIWMLRSDLIRRRAEHFRKQMACLPSSGVTTGEVVP